MRNIDDLEEHGNGPNMKTIGEISVIRIEISQNFTRSHPEAFVDRVIHTPIGFTHPIEVRIRFEELNSGVIRPTINDDMF